MMSGAAREMNAVIAITFREIDIYSVMFTRSEKILHLRLPV